MDLDRDARAELRSLPASLAETRSRGTSSRPAALLDEDPQRAHAHAAYARQLAPRLAVVREAAGVTAYAAGDYAGRPGRAARRPPDHRRPERTCR